MDSNPNSPISRVVRGVATAADIQAVREAFANLYAYAYTHGLTSLAMVGDPVSVRVLRAVEIAMGETTEVTFSRQ